MFNFAAGENYRPHSYRYRSSFGLTIGVGRFALDFLHQSPALTSFGSWRKSADDTCCITTGDALGVPTRSRHHEQPGAGNTDWHGEAKTPRVHRFSKNACARCSMRLLPTTTHFSRYRSRALTLLAFATNRPPLPQRPLGQNLADDPCAIRTIVSPTMDTTTVRILAPPDHPAIGGVCTSYRRSPRRETDRLVTANTRLPSQRRPGSAVKEFEAPQSANGAPCAARGSYDGFRHHHSLHYTIWSSLYGIDWRRCLDRER